MENLNIEKSTKKNTSVTRTIRMSGKNFDRITELAEKHEISFNSVVNQIIDFGLKHIDSKEKKK